MVIIVNTETKPIIQDISVVVLSVLVAVMLVQTGSLHTLLLSTKEYEVFSSFFAGMFFTSVFTTAPAIVALGEIATQGNLFVVSVLGAVGAMCGDALIFAFVKNKLSEHVSLLIGQQTRRKRVRHFFKSRLIRIFSFVLGGIIIASPLPDELGIGLMGISKMKTRYFLVLSFAFNFIGILLIGITARALVG